LERWRQFVSTGLDGFRHGDDEAAVTLRDVLGVDDGSPTIATQDDCHAHVRAIITVPDSRT
jgi:hypothetical protein